MEKEYGFYDRLTEEFPSQVVVDLCEVCNYECIHCPQSAFKKGKQFSGAFLEEGLNRKMVDEVRTFGVGKTQQIRYTANGEPLMHLKAVELIQYAVEKSGVFVSLTTNGSLMNRDMASTFLRMGLGLIDFSLDAFQDETYAEIRRKGNLEKVRQNILEALAIKKEMNVKTKIVVSFVVQEKNINEQAAFKKYWESQGVDFVIFRKLHSAGKSMKTYKKVDIVQPCVYPWERITLNGKGELAFCPNDWFENMVICGDYSKSTIHDVWNGEDYKQLRKEHLEGRFEKFAQCADCPDRALTIWPANRQETDRGYGDMIKDFIDHKED